MEGLGAKILSLMAYNDHYPYTQKDADNIDAAADSAGAGFIVTTEKDAVKLAGLNFRHAVLVLGIEMDITGGREALEALVLDRIKYN